MQEIRSAYDAGDDSLCLVRIDTLRSRYPTAIEHRKEALSYQQKANERIAQKDLERTDRLLEQARADFNAMQRRVDQHKAQLNATADELTALTRKRMERDSLQTRYEVLCNEIRFIHKKQKDSEK